MNNHQNTRGPLVIITILFFMWGFITCMNDILIPKLKQVFDLLEWQAMLIQTAFFGAYFVISLIYFLISASKGDPISNIGYKNGIIIGLVVSAIGCGLFIPAASFESFTFFLGALFILASGITILQIAANPYVAVLGNPDGASGRLNMAQAFNSFGTTIAPVIGGILIFNAAENTVGADSVKIPYFSLAVILILLAVFFRVIHLPKFTDNEEIVAGTGSLKYKHLVLGVIAIFTYVGAEVTIGSSFIEFALLPEIGGFSEKEASYFLAFYWGGAMVGRFFGAIALSDSENNSQKYLWLAGIASIVFVAVYSIYGLNEALITLGIIAFNIIILFIGSFIPNKTLGWYALATISLLLIGMTASGTIALWSVIAIGIFNSIMFPTIFTLAIKGLGKYTGQASSLLVMAIVGGAIIPPIQGYFIDATGDRQLSLIIPLICYLYICFYGFKGYKPDEKVLIN
ncbi:sugar MFS transporter [Marinigracilibium pacificum]|uniref:Sugar MFS transporter n=1 Tax=Marinigracilibium pacificum TaxID=2729599 RepID=A0A848IW28_9BACT|nr:sugar MFS transporter [Marinigracilibium pacificum]NMM47378.1 sugar MFS transporter [Marinigracilibium pacificum]